MTPQRGKTDVLLQPCPFCGSKAEMFEDSHHNKPDFRVWCTECSCEMVEVYFSEAEAIAAWNRRPTSGDGLREALDQLPDDILWYLDEMDDPEARELANAVRRARSALALSAAVAGAAGREGVRNE